MPKAWPPRPVGRPGKAKTFKFKRRKRRFDLPTPITPQFKKDDEGLTGFVRGYCFLDAWEGSTS